MGKPPAGPNNPKPPSRPGYPRPPARRKKRGNLFDFITDLIVDLIS